MIVFECPSCKAKLQVADQHAGATIQCPTCKGMTSAPKNVETSVAAVPVMLVAAPSPAPTAVTTPEVAEAAQAERSAAMMRSRAGRGGTMRMSPRKSRPAWAPA